MMHRGPRLLQMKFELAFRNTQQDKTTKLNHTDGGDMGSLQMEPKTFHQRNRMPEAQLSSSAITNKPHDEGANTFTMGSRGTGEGTEGSHLQNHNRADYL